MPRTKSSTSSKKKKSSLSPSSPTSPKRLSQAKRAGLIFPPKRFTNRLKAGNYAKRIGLGSGLYLAAILEYLVAEVVELAGKAASDNSKRRISPRHIMMAVRNDAELSDLLKEVHFKESGVLPSIPRILLHTIQQRRKLQRDGELPSDNVLSSQVEEVTPQGDSLIFAENPASQSGKVLIQAIKKEKRVREVEEDEEERKKRKKEKKDKKRKSSLKQEKEKKSKSKSDESASKERKEKEERKKRKKSGSDSPSPKSY